MIRSNNWVDLITSNPKDIKNIFLGKMSTCYSFKDTDKFPEEKGIYFIFKNKADAQNKTKPIYIGEVHAEERNFKKRCCQYVQQGNGGNSVRKKIEEIFNYSQVNAINYIKNNFYCCFYSLSENKSIEQIEKVAIWCFQPILNFIKNDFNYDDLVI